MPTVMRFDDPMLVAQLGQQASDYAVNQDQRQQAMQLQQMADQNARAQQELQLKQRQQQLAEQLSHPQMITVPGIEQHGTSGTTYNPSQQIPVNQLGQYGQLAQAMETPDGAGGSNFNAARGSNLFGRGGAGMGYVHPQQKMMIAQVDQMEHAGQLQPAEAARWRMVIQTGGNPFTEKTASEVISEKGRSDALTAYQQAMLEQRKAATDTKGELDERKTRRQTILDQIKVNQDILKSAAGDPDLQKETAAELKRLTKELVKNGQEADTGVPGTSSTIQGPPDPSKSSSTPTPAGGKAPPQAAAAKKVQIEVTRLTPELSDKLVLGYGSAAAAKEAIARYGSAQKALQALIDSGPRL